MLLVLGSASMPRSKVELFAAIRRDSRVEGLSAAAFLDSLQFSAMASSTDERSRPDQPPKINKWAQNSLPQTKSRRPGGTKTRSQVGLELTRRNHSCPVELNTRRTAGVTVIGRSSFSIGVNERERLRDAIEVTQAVGRAGIARRTDHGITARQRREPARGLEPLTARLQGLRSPVHRRSAPSLACGSTLA